MSYIETAARYEKMQENGTVKKVTERFIVNALTCTEAEAITIEQLTPYVSGELEVTANKKVNIADVFNPDSADKYFLAKVAFITIDEKTAAEKRSVSQWLIGATDFNDAYKTLLREIGKCLAGVEVVSLAETPIVEYFKPKN